MKSWKTTVCGVVAAIAVAWQAYDFNVFDWKTFVTVGALAAFGFFSRDNNKTSENVGAK